MRLWAACAIAVIAACSGSDSDAVTTTTAVDCPGFRVGEIHDNPPECWPAMLEEAATDHGVELTPSADGQARSLCRRVDVEGVRAGTLSVLADWETGAAAKPADDVSGFVALAIAVYCPVHYEALRAG